MSGVNANLASAASADASAAHSTGTDGTTAPSKSSRVVAYGSCDCWALDLTPSQSRRSRTQPCQRS